MLDARLPPRAVAVVLASDRIRVDGGRLGGRGSRPPLDHGSKHTTDTVGRAAEYPLADMSFHDRGVFGLEGLGERLGLLSGVVLAVSSFTGWYTGDGQGVTVSVLGWDTGTLGKLVLFVGLAVVLVISLRELGVRPPAQLPESLVTIVLGALATIFVLIRVISIPDDFFFAGRGVGIWIALAAALGVLVAGLLQASEEL